MTLAQMGREMSAGELSLQMAFDRVEVADHQAARQGLPTAAQTHAAGPSRRLSMTDPDLFAKLDRYWPPERRKDH